MRTFRRHSIALAVRWTARLLSVFPFGLFLILFVAYRGGPYRHPSDLLVRPFGETVLGAAFLIMMFGLPVAWRWEGIGSAMILGGFAAFAAGGIRLNMVFASLPITGFLFLLCWWLDRRR
jgi:hypothetical protein